MAQTFKITSATTDGQHISLSAKVSIQIGTRNNEKGKAIPIMASRSVTIGLLIADLPKHNILDYVKQKIEGAYAEIPDLSIVNQLIEKEWISIIQPKL